MITPWIDPVVTPALAKIMNQTYSAGLRVQFDHISNDRRSRSILDTKTIVDMPVMVGSSLCLTTKVHSEEDRMRLGICLHDPEGYFIVQGTA